MMSDTHLLRQMVNERLAAAAEEIFGLVEKTIAEYQDEVFRCRSEVIVLKRQMEQLSVLKPEVQLLKTDVQECALDQPDQNPTLENSDTPDHQQAEQEQLDLWSNPDLEEPEYYEDYQVPLSDSDLTCPTFTVSTMTCKDEEDWHEIDSVSPSCDPICSDIPFTANESAQRDEMKKKADQKDKKQIKACRLCHMCFQTYVELRKHMKKNHKGEKAFKCTLCGKGFEDDSSLTVHVRIHTGEKPYSCDFCDKTFAQKSQRLSHLRWHTKEKPYYCVKCNKHSASSNHFKRCGARRKGEENPFLCRTCGRTFNTDFDLRLHKEVHNSWKWHLEEN